MRDILDKLDESERTVSKFLIDLATDESEFNSPIKVTQQESSEEVMYLSRTRKRTIRSKMVIAQIYDMKMKLGSKKTFKKLGRRKWTLKFQQRLSTQPNESVSKKSWIWGTAMGDCLARPSR